MLVLQMLGAEAEFERNLIRERTKAGIACRQGAGVGWPAVRVSAGVIRRCWPAWKREERMDGLSGCCRMLNEWLATVRRLRPAQSWENVTVAVNAALPPGCRSSTLDRLVRSVRLLVRDVLVGAALLTAAPNGGGVRKPPTRRDMEIAAAYASGRPGAALAEIGVELQRMKALPPTGGDKWAPSSVKALLDRAREVW